MNANRAKLILTLVGALASVASGSATAVQDEANKRAFQIYDTQAAKALQAEANEHLSAGRYSEGLTLLQELIERHDGEVLGVTRPRPRGSARASQSEVHPGAGAWAIKRLFELPPAARRLYIERHGPRAQAALERALETGDRAALADLGGRWPLTPAAQRAWWALGDLELESSYEDAGLVAWGRGLAMALSRPGLSLSQASDWMDGLASLEELSDKDPAQARLLPGARARIERAVRIVARRDAERATGGERWISALVGDPRIGRAFSRDTQAWHQGFDLVHSPYPAGYNNLYPAREGDRLFACTSMELFAVGALTGEQLWHIPMTDLGWRRSDYLSGGRVDYDAALDPVDALIAPAVAQGIVVAPLRIPFVFINPDRFRNLEIIKAMPERRLFAFDAATGERLWDNDPGRLWDGESGRYQDRATVVGPPVISGRRVLVPTARMRGRIEFHVGCYDLFSGELQWYTPLISGQRELNMFGRWDREFCAPPVALAGDRVIVQTQLGALASLDLFTGDVLWQTVYPQLPISRATYYAEGVMSSDWKNAPPRIDDQVVVAAPVDSEYLAGYDLESGAMLWRIEHETLQDLVSPQGSRSLSYLVGVAEGRVYLGGKTIAAFDPLNGDLAKGEPALLAWAFPQNANEYLNRHAPRAVLTETSVYVPDNKALYEIDRSTGRQRDEFDWGTDPGSLLLGEGQLFTLGSSSLYGYFQWEALISRAEQRVATNPEDADALERLAVLLLERGLVQRSRVGAGELPTALSSIRRARRILEEALKSDESAAALDLESALFRVLLEEAETHKLAADPRSALAALEDALPRAPDTTARAETLLRVQALQRGRDEEQRRRTLTTLLDQHAGMPVVCSVTSHERRGEPRHYELHPVVPPPAARTGSSYQVLPLGLWALHERVESRRLEGGGSASAAEFADLHRVLAEYPDQPLHGRIAWDWAAERIEAKLASGERTGYERFENEAQKLLGQALEERSLATLESVIARFPHSSAADRASLARVDLALAGGDLGLAAHVLIGELDAEWTAADAPASQRLQLAQLAHLIGVAGNLELRAGLLQRLAQARPDEVFELADLGRASAKEWAQRFAAEVPQVPADPPGRFAPSLQRVAVRPGRLTPLGVVQRPDGPLWVVASYDSNRQNTIFEAFTPLSEEPVWTHERPLSVLTDGLAKQTALGREHSHAILNTARGGEIVTLDIATGEQTWKWSPGAQGRLAAIERSDGVLVASVNGPHEGAAWLAGLDAYSGAELWRLGDVPMRNNPQRARYVMGDGYIVLIPQSDSITREPAPLEVYDLFLGTLVSRPLVGNVSLWTGEAAWIEDGRLILVAVLEKTGSDDNRIAAFDLASGDLAWNIALGPKLEVLRVLHHADGHLLEFENPDGGRNRKYALYALNTRVGALDTSPLAEYEINQGGLVGLPKYAATRLATPWILQQSKGPRGSDKLRAIHARFGPRWTAPLGNDVLPGVPTDLPTPVFSEGAVALALRRKVQGNLRRDVFALHVFDLATGEATLNRDIQGTTRRGQDYLLFPVGDTLYVCGPEVTEVYR